MQKCQVVVLDEGFWYSSLLFRETSQYIVRTIKIREFLKPEANLNPTTFQKQNKKLVKSSYFFDSSSQTVSWSGFKNSKKIGRQVSKTNSFKRKIISKIHLLTRIIFSRWSKKNAETSLKIRRFASDISPAQFDAIGQHQRARSRIQHVIGCSINKTGD